MLALIEAHEGRAVSGAATHARQGRPGHRVAWLVGAAAATLVGAVSLQSLGAQPAVAAPLPLLQFGVSDIEAVLAGEAPGAREELLALADAAASRPDEAPAGEVTRVETYRWSLDVDHTQSDSTLMLVGTQEVTWVAPDRSMRQELTRQEVLSPDGSEDLDGVTPSGSEVESYDVTGDAFGTDRFALAVLPTEAGALREYVFDASTLPPTGAPSICRDSDAEQIACLVDALVSITTRNAVPGEVQAAFWGALAQEDAMAYLGPVTDRLGRSGMAVAALGPHPAHSNDVVVLIADPETGELLGHETITPDGNALAEDGNPLLGIDGPVVQWLRVFVDTRFVGEIGAD